MSTARGDEPAAVGLPGLRSVLAPNPGPMTLEGTRTWLVGVRRVAVIDPGPALPAHTDAVADAVGDGVVAAILLTHDHPDHAGGAAALAERLAAPVRGGAAAPLAPGETVATDAGTLVAVPTPGHAPDHVAFHWPEARAVFCGDLLLGGVDSTLVAPPGGNLHDYLLSLERVRELRPDVLLPAHGPPLQTPDEAIDAYILHRHERIEQLRAALTAGPATPAALAEAVYGAGIDPRLRDVAVGAVIGYLEHMARLAVVRALPDGRWALACA